MDNSELSQWFDSKIELLKESNDQKDIRLMLELLKARSLLRVNDKVVEKMDYDTLSDDELLIKLQTLQ